MFNPTTTLLPAIAAVTFTATTFAGDSNPGAALSGPLLAQAIQAKAVAECDENSLA